MQNLSLVWRSFITSDAMRRLKSRGVSGKTYKRLNITRQHALSAYRSAKERALFRDIDTYCLFIGHARSGHNIIGALLDAHQHIVLPDEVDTLQYVAAGFEREQIYHMLLARSRRQAQKQRIMGERDERMYTYYVPGQWQGRFTTIRAIGSSKVGTTIRRLAQNPALLGRLQDTMGGVRVKLVLVTRNPFDTISTMILRGGGTCEERIDRYFANCAVIAGIRARADAPEIFTVRQEDIIYRPATYLGALCRFLGVEPTDDYLRDCAGILYSSPARSRYQLYWNDTLLAAVQTRISQFDFLAGYSYAD